MSFSEHQSLRPTVRTPPLLAHLYDVVHVGQEAVQANFQKHDERSAHVLSHLGLLVRRQSEQVLRGGRGAAKRQG